MPKKFEDHGLITHILDLLAPWDEVNPRRMFGGVGLFAHGLMFAMIIDEVLYLKDSLDDNGKPVKTAFKKEYFEYDRKDKTVRLSYYKAPDRALEEGAYLIELVAASHRSASLTKKSVRVKAPAKTQSKRPSGSASR